MRALKVASRQWESLSLLALNIQEILNNCSAMDFRDLKVYQKAFVLSMKIYHRSKDFPKEEMYSLTSQIRRSSRGVCSNIGEGYRKRQYPAHFVNKISDADMENSETGIWLDYSLACGYISNDEKKEFDVECKEIGRMLNHMINYPEKYTVKARKVSFT